MSKFGNIAKQEIVNKLLREFVDSQYKTQNVLCEGLDKKSNLHYAIQLGEQTAKNIQIDILNEYLDQHPILKEDIFQRGAAKAKAWLTTPLGKGFGQAKDTQIIQNLFGALKKNTEKIVSAGPSPFTPSEEDVKNSPTQIGQIGALIGKRFAALQNNPKLNTPATPTEQQAGMGRIEQLISKLRASGFVKGADNILDEIGIFARQHPTLSNLIVSGLVAVTVLMGGPVAAIPMLTKFVVGVALRTFLGVLKGEKATQAATKAAVVSGFGIALGKILGLFYDKLASWIVGQADGSALPLPVGGTPPAPGQPYVAPEDLKTTGGYNWQTDTNNYDELGNRIPDSPEQLTSKGGYNWQTDTNNYEDLGNRIPDSPEQLTAPEQVPNYSGAPQPAAGDFATPQVTTPVNLTPKLSTLSSLVSTTDVKGGTAQAARQAVQNWVNGISQPEAQEMLKDPNITKQLMRKGALGALKKKFNIQESELDLLKAELIGSTVALTEANPLTAAKNFMFGGPQVGGKNARLDYKQVESDYLKFLNNMESQLGLKTEKDILDTLKKYDKTFPGVYDYVKKVRNWLYGATPEANKPQPESVIVPPSEIPTPTNPEPSPQKPTKPEELPTEPPKPGDPASKGGSYSNKNLAKFLTGLKGSPLFTGNLQQRILNMLKASDNPNSPEAKAGMARLKTFLINFNKAISDASAQYRQKVGDPNDVRAEITKDPQFAPLAEAAADLLAQNKERRAFINEFTAVIPNLVGATAELRQVFNKKNPNSVYNFNTTPAQPPKLSMPPQKAGVKIAPPVIGGQPGLPTGFAPKNEDLETKGKPVTANTSATGNLTGPDIANARAMFAKLIDLGPILQGLNPNGLTKTNLKQLIITCLDIGDILVYKKGSKKTNKAVDTALQGLDLLGPGQAAAQPQQQGGFKPKEKLIIRAKQEENPLTPNAVFQYLDGKWNSVSRKGLQPLDPKGFAKQIAKLNTLAKDGRDDESLVTKLSYTDPEFEKNAFQHLKEESIYKLSDYKKFF